MTREEIEPTREEVINKLIGIKNFNYSLAPFLNKAISDIKRTEDLEELLSGVSHGDVLRELRFSELEAENKRLKEGIAAIKAEIEKQEKWLMRAEFTIWNVDTAFNAIKLVVKKGE